MNRNLINNLKTQLQIRISYITKVFESIESEEQYDSFVNMCGTHLEFCNFWQRRLKRKIIGFRPFKNYKLYKDYVEFAKYTVAIAQNHINEYNAIIQEAVKDQELLESTQKRLEMEFHISNALNDSKLEEIRKNEIMHVTGFANKSKSKKRKNKS